MQIEMTEKNMQTTLAKDIEKFDWINNIFVNNPNSS